MLSKIKLKLIRSLARKKFREEHGLFLVEGEKMVAELLAQPSPSPFRIRELFATASWIGDQPTSLWEKDISPTEVSQQELDQASSLKSPQPVLALVEMPGYELNPGMLAPECMLAFEAIRDPGNLGTIMRTADWFGIRHILCSPDSVDCFNPKVVQATMGAFLRVQVHYTDLEQALLLPSWKDKPVYGTLLQGENIYETSLEPAPVVVFGNEARGMSPGLKHLIGKALTIPSFSPDGRGSESLNLASSVAVVCSEIRRPTRNGN